MCAAADVKTGLDVFPTDAKKAPSPGDPGALKPTIKPTDHPAWRA